MADIKLTPSPTQILPWTEHLSITSKTATLSADLIEDDLKRELAMYTQALTAVTRAHVLLQEAGVPIHRPLDYYAEMVKSDEHMGRVRMKLVEEAKALSEAEKARKLRDAKKVEHFFFQIDPETPITIECKTHDTLDCSSERRFSK